ncbi:MAG TPA: LysM domain-containing protein [Gaiellaceae bacterium]|nr:LysM domain-containing protein [Gaiellaceae bacterium]
MVSGNRTAARFAAPAAFLAAFTVAIVLVRGALNADGEPASEPTPAAQTQPAATTAAEPADTQPVTLPATTAAAAAEAEYYEIQSGDTLETIAAAHDTTVESLLTLNPDVDPVALTIGQRIRIR